MFGSGDQASIHPERPANLPNLGVEKGLERNDRLRLLVFGYIRVLEALGNDQHDALQVHVLDGVRGDVLIDGGKIKIAVRLLLADLLPTLAQRRLGRQHEGLPVRPPRFVV